MSTILLDTSVIFDHLNGRHGRTEYLDDLLRQGHTLACCPVNLKGQTLSYSGVTIAAVALANGLGLLTDNRKHFPMPELNLFPLPSPPEPATQR